MSDEGSLSRVLWDACSRPPQRNFYTSCPGPEASSTIAYLGAVSSARPPLRAGGILTDFTGIVLWRRCVLPRYRRRLTHLSKIPLVESGRGYTAGRTWVGLRTRPGLVWTSREHCARTRLVTLNRSWTSLNASATHESYSVRGHSSSPSLAPKNKSNFSLCWRSAGTVPLRSTKSANNTDTGLCTVGTEASSSSSRQRFAWQCTRILRLLA